MIVKVQKCINPPGGPYMVFDRERSHAVMINVKDMPGHATAALGTELKAYFEAHWDAANDTWIVGKRVEAHKW